MDNPRAVRLRHFLLPQIFGGEVLIPLLGRVDHPTAGPFRRLFFEAYTACATDLRRRVERNLDEPPRRLSGPEHEERRKAVASRLVGLRNEGLMEPSHEIINLVVDIVESNVLKHISRDRFTTRQQEIDGVKADPSFKKDASAYLREVPKPPPAIANLERDTPRVCAEAPWHCLRDRGLMPL